MLNGTRFSVSLRATDQVMFSFLNLPARRSGPRVARPPKMDENNEMFNLIFNINGERIECSFPIDSTDHLFKITSKCLLKQKQR